MVIRTTDMDITMAGIVAGVNITYSVQWGEWEVKEDPSIDYDNLSLEDWAKLPEADCSDKIHSGTEKARIFTSETEAMEFAKEKWEGRDKWLAYLRIRKCIHEDIFDFFK